MNTDQMKDEVNKNIEKLSSLRDEVKVKLHLATLDAKQEWNDKLSPKVFEVEQAAKNITDTTSNAVKDIVTKMEHFLARIGRTSN